MGRRKSSIDDEGGGTFHTFPVRDDASPMRNRLACVGAREKGTCDNRLTMRRDGVEARVLKPLHAKLLRQDLFDEFCDESRAT